LLDDIREIMFNQELYQNITVQKIMSLPPELIELDENMEKVMEKFELTGAWSLPVVDKGEYIGFVSKSKIFSVYRSVLIDYSDE
jgi:CIC family chloride channel protein